MDINWNEINNIIYDVIDITNEKLVKWNMYSDDGINTYFIDLGKGRIAICRQYESMDDEYDYIMTIFNEVGEEIYGCSTGYEDRENQTLLQHLYDVAENSNLQRQATMDSIKQAISKIKSDNFI